MAQAFRGGFTALFVETPAFPSLSEEDKNRLRKNIHLAEQLGATIETTYGDDVALQIAEFARLSGVSKIVIGRNNAKKRFFFSKPTLTEKLIAYAAQSGRLCHSRQHGAGLPGTSAPGAAKAAAGGYSENAGYPDRRHLGRLGL